MGENCCGGSCGAIKRPSEPWYKNGWSISTAFFTVMTTAFAWRGGWWFVAAALCAVVALVCWTMTGIS